MPQCIHLAGFRSTEKGLVPFRLPPPFSLRNVTVGEAMGVIDLQPSMLDSDSWKCPVIVVLV